MAVDGQAMVRCSKTPPLPELGGEPVWQTYCLKARLLPATAARHVCCACRWSFDAPVWQMVSPDAQALIRSCLRRAPWRRPTAEALLQSVWIDQAPPEKLWPGASLGKVG